MQFGKYDMIVHYTDKDCKNGETTFGYPFIGNGDLTEHDAHVSETALATFFETCLLPLAMSTNALIIVHGGNDCTSAVVLNRIVAPVQARLGSSCPFTVLCTMTMERCYAKSCDPSSYTGKVKMASPTWQGRSALLEDHYSKPCWKPPSEITSSASHIILFEGIDAHNIGTGKQNNSFKATFEAILLETLTEKLPAVAINLQNGDWSEIASYIRRNVPVLMLDWREREFTATVPSHGPITDLANQANSFPGFSEQDLKEIGPITIDSSGRLCQKAKRAILKKAFGILDNEAKVLCEAGIRNGYTGSDVALIISALRFGQAGSQGGRSKDQLTPLYARIHEQEEMERQSQVSEGNDGDMELVKEAINYVMSNSHANILSQQISIHVKFLETHGTSHKNYAEALKRCENFREQLASKKPNGDWLMLFHFFTSPCIFSSSIHNLGNCKAVLNSVVRIDRLPESNSLQANLTLQDAYDHIEVYHRAAGQYKFITKVSYAILLFAGVMITAASLGESNSSALNNGVASGLILAMSLLASTIGAFVAFMNPAQRWQQLRGAALKMESNIWKFRTRSGEYRVSRSDLFAEADKQLFESMSQIKANVFEGGDVKSTSFFGERFSLNLHEQHPPGSRGFGFKEASVSGSFQLTANSPVELILKDCDGNGKLSLHEIATQKTKVVEDKRRPGNAGLDTHYSPLQPEAYISARIEPALAFYANRIPKNSRVVKVSKIILVLGSVSGVVLVLYSLSRWAAAISILTSGVAAWLEFNGALSKTSRYSAVVDGLQTLVVWWKTLDVIDRSVVKNIDSLVQTAEDIIKSEHEVWASIAARANKLLNEAADGKDKKCEAEV